MSLALPQNMPSLMLQFSLATAICFLLLKKRSEKESAFGLCTDQRGHTLLSYGMLLTVGFPSMILIS